MMFLIRRTGRRSAFRNLHVDPDPSLRVEGLVRGHKQHFFRRDNPVSEWNMDSTSPHTRRLWVRLTARDGTWTSYMSEYRCRFEPTYSDEGDGWCWIVRGLFDIKEGAATSLSAAVADVLALANSGAIAAAEKRKKLARVDW